MIIMGDYLCRFEDGKHPYAVIQMCRKRSMCS